MRLLICSDLHLDANERFTGIDILDPIIKAFQNQDPDAVIIAGDLSGDAQRTLHYIQTFKQKLRVPIYFVPGNHDIWTQSHDAFGSKKSYQLLYEDASSLLRNPLIEKNTVVLGAMSWYDYSFGPKNIHKDNFSFEKKHVWNDAKFAKWGEEDERLCNRMLTQLEKELTNHLKKDIILVNHFIPYEEFITVKENEDWNFCNAYMGSAHLGELIDRHPNIKTVIFGHTHRRYGVIEHFRSKTIICKPLGYYSEWEGDHIEEEIEKVITIVEI